MPNNARPETEPHEQLSVEERIDAICDDFESQWTKGPRPDLETFVERGQPADRELLFLELVLVECELLGRQAESPDWGNILNRFPQFSEQIELAQIRHALRSWDPQSNSLAAEPVKRLGRFDLSEKLGAGAAGEVWKAYDPRLQRTVAVKFPRWHQSSDAEVDRFLREARAAAQLAHENIVPVFEVACDGDTAYIVAAYVAGKSLRDYAGSVRLSFRDVATLCQRLAEALDHAHERGVIHRDLKPSNVIIDDAGQPHITDFGLAKWSDGVKEATLDGQMLGTPAYMSPEQAQGKSSRADRRTDVYALGVILYELLAGRGPFQGDVAAITYQIIHDEPPNPSKLARGIPRDLETICLKAMEKSPDSRYATALDMSSDLQRFLQGDPIRARRCGQIERAMRWTRKRPVIVLLGIAILTALSALTVARRLNQEKQSLLDMQVVSLTTEPAGARVAFAPLDETTGEPNQGAVVQVGRRTPIQQELRPGNYLVVVTLDDGRFHEVYRRVPASNGGISGAFAHNRWVRAGDQTVTISTIKIPDLTIIAPMIRIPNADPAPQRSGRSDSVALLVDASEFTIADYQRVYDGSLPGDQRSKPGNPEDVAFISYDNALAAAEKAGKRLPSEAEYNRIHEFLVNSGLDPELKTVDAPTLDGLSPTTTPGESAGGDRPSWRRLAVAEWTTSRDAVSAILNGNGPQSTPNDYQIVRGSRFTGSQLAAGSYHDRASVPRQTVAQGLGFRCVRSAAPRLLDVKANAAVSPDAAD